MSCILGLDVGTKTIGVARARGRMAFPVTTLRRKSVRHDTEQLYQICRKNGVTAVVVGLPLELDGGEGRSARLARQIGEALAARTGLPVHYQDERYSTVEASRRLTEQGLSARQQRSVIDQAAAAVILQDWIDQHADEQG